MQIENFFQKEIIDFHLKATTKQEAINQLASLLAKNGKLKDKQVYEAAVLAREADSTTGVGNGIAIPHGKSIAVNETCLAIGRCETPIEWESLDDQPVHLIFLLAVTENDQNEVHLRILAQLAELLIDETFVENLKNAKTTEELLALLTNR
jgi:PTS system fructose-specific IIA component